MAKDCTLEEAKEAFEEENTDFLKENTFSFIIAGNEINFEDHDIANVRLTTLGHESGRVIKVKTQ